MASSAQGGAFQSAADNLRRLRREIDIRHPSRPGNVRYQRPPVVEPVETLVLESGERLQGEIKYYDYGVPSLVFELAFMDGWSKLTRLASRWASCWAARPCGRE
jgi:hypothetical protein